MNPPEFRLLAIWQSVVEIKKPRLKMFAYRKIASQVGVSDRSVRENIKKLVEQGYLVESDNWFVLNLDNEFIKYIVTNYTHLETRETQVFEESRTICVEADLELIPMRGSFDSDDEVCYKREVPKVEVERKREIPDIPKPSAKMSIPSFGSRSSRTLAHHSVLPSRGVEIAQESISKFRQMFGDEAEMAMDFFKKEVLRNY